MDIALYFTETLLQMFNPSFCPKFGHMLLFHAAESQDTLTMSLMRCRISGYMSVYSAKYVDIPKMCS